MSQSQKTHDLNGSEIAIIGMSCRFPGAGNPEEFWSNLCKGVESFARVTAKDLEQGGLDRALLDDPRYVPFVPAIDEIEYFDADFFGYTSFEAKIMDPQHRLFLECAWEAFEQAGYVPESYRGKIGVFTGSKTNTYLFSLFANRDFFESLDHFQIALGNDLACMATRVAYKLNLRGPSYAIHTACSTSLVATHLACQSLLLGECKMALAGGAAINVPQRRGYFYQTGGILSPDGRCRTFDADAQGSNFGNGVGAVLLKRLDDALSDGDHIYAIIRGSASNNDGAHKASYTAPGVEGQTDVLLEAMACAGIEADTISYIEAHGTATELGDAIELLALRDAFRASSQRKGYCALGSVKTNIGHLETAAGVAGLIKTALALHHRQIPPSLNFERPNSKINFSESPFYVNTQLAEWKSEERSRRAGVSSFGIGSANAHVILEEAPPQPDSRSSRPWQLLLLSARSETALDAMTSNLIRHFEQRRRLGESYLADAAYTLQVGRKSFACRRAAVFQSLSDAGAIAEALDPSRALTQIDGAVNRKVAFLFPGLGDHYPRMGASLYQSEATFRHYVDLGAELLRPHLEFDIREVLYPKEGETGTGAGSNDRRLDLRRMLGRSQQSEDEISQRLSQTLFIQPATFVIEYALAKLWIEWGVRPQAMIGYSLGEYVAACLAGVFSYEDAVALVARRARMIQDLPGGAMLALPLSEQEVAPLLANDDLSLAVVNGPSMCVLAGPVAAIESVERECGSRGVLSRRLQTSHAFHSKMMEVLARPLTEFVKTLKLSKPQIPYLSNVTGAWIRNEEATDPNYWAMHMTGTVRFNESVRELIREKDQIILEVGPGQSLTSLVKQHPDCDQETARLACASMPGAYDTRPEHAFLLETLGKLWLAGQTPDWTAFHAEEARRRVPLPTYSFERQRYWVDPPSAEAGSKPRRLTLEKKAEISDWFYQPVWKPSSGAPPALATSGEESRWLVLADDLGLGARIVDRLRQAGQDVVTVRVGESFACRGEHEFTIDPRRLDDYINLLSVAGKGVKIGRIVHLWSASSSDLAVSRSESFQESQDLGFNSLLCLAQAIGRQFFSEAIRLEVVTSNLHRVTGRESLYPEKATILGPARVIPQEFPKITCRCVDIVSPKTDVELEALAEQLITEFRIEPDDKLIAYREGERFAQDFEPMPLPEAAEPIAKLRTNGVYLITGGLGGLGLELAEHLAKKVKARLALTGRTALPDRLQWPDLLEADGKSPIAERIRACVRLEELGAEVLTIAADASDESQMRQAIDQARQRFGTIHGVIHLAGAPGGGIIQLKTIEMAEQILAPKVRGTLVIEKLFENQALDFLALYSSIQSVLGEFGQADYCGANAFLDAVAQRNALRGGPHTVAINWDIWREVGITVDTEVPPHMRQLRDEMLEKGILNREGLEAFDRILSSGLPQIIVSTQDLPGRIELGKSLTGESFLQELQKASGTGSRAPRRVLGTGHIAASSDLEQTIAEVWQQILGTEQIGVNDNFFDLGGNSLLGLQLVSELSRELGLQIAPVMLFEFPTIGLLARHLNPQPQEAHDGAAGALQKPRGRLARRSDSQEIAIIGMAGRFPGARNIEGLWKNLCDGVESLTFFTDEELLASGVPPALLSDPLYVKAGAILEDIDQFDAGLFGFSPREAEVMDPQHRIFLECAWEALERAGYDPLKYKGAIGVFAGSNLSSYLFKLYADSRVRNSLNMFQTMLGNDKDSLTTMVSYKLNLRGPSIAVQTFCSTSLVATHMACRSLRNGECDMALAGGIRVVTPDRQGYFYEPGGIAPSDGHTRSFDAKANGSIFGHGVGIVCLKRLEDALADGDHIHAVIKGSAINNDGSQKAGYTAPSVAGQAEVISAALEDAGIDPESLSYVETHGSATALGDPIEIAALTKAFRDYTEKKNFCAVGSIKSNFGHLDRAAGVTALIKTALSLERKRIPASINFDEPNPQIDFANSPFYVNSSLYEWEANGGPRRAGVNSLGVGGTNVHLILEESPPAQPSSESRPFQLLLLSAKTQAALDAATENLAQHLDRNADSNLADIAYTLKTGRRSLGFRSILVCQDVEDARTALVEKDPRRLLTAYQEEGERGAIFMFPGLGGQYLNMARGLYESEPVFRKEVDRCSEALIPYLGLDLRKEVYPQASGKESKEEKPSCSAAPLDLRKMLGRGSPSEDDSAIHRTSISQPLLFVIEYALARLWIQWGIRPQAMVGYSLGEYVAACLAGVFSLDDALKIVALRARMTEDLAPGALLAVGLPEDRISPMLGEELSLMAVNGPEQCVVSGPIEAIETLQARLNEIGASQRRLQASHAFHSRMMEPIFDSVVALVESVERRPPQIPFISNITGTWIRSEEAVDPAYWARHMCLPVRFSESIEELLKDRRRVLLEVGPPSLSSIILQHPAAAGEEQPFTLNLLRHSYESQQDLAFALQALGKLWLLGVEPDWTAFYAHERRLRVLLPTYPFQRQRYWIDAQEDWQETRRYSENASQEGWFYIPSWKRTSPGASLEVLQSGNGQNKRQSKLWIFMDEQGLGDRLAQELERAGHGVTRLEADSDFAQPGPARFKLGADHRENYVTLLETEGGPPEAIIYLRGLVDSRKTDENKTSGIWDDQCISNLLALSQIFQEREIDRSIPVWIVSDRLHDIVGEEVFQPIQAGILGACAALAKQCPNLTFKNLDLALHNNGADHKQKIVAQLLTEIANGAPERVIAYRGGHRWIPALASTNLKPGNGDHSKSSAGQNYLVINGLSELGFVICKHLDRNASHRLILIEPADLPSRELWDEWLTNDAGEGLITAKIRRFKALEEHAETFCFGSDLADAGQAHSLLAGIKQRFGPLRGIIYISDSVSDRSPALAIADAKSPDELLSNKSQSLYSLNEAIRDDKLAFRLLVSQARAKDPATGADYAWTLFLDAFASKSARDEDQHWTSVTWDFSPENGPQAALSQAIERLLAPDGPAQLIFSPEPLANDWNKVQSLLDSSQTQPAAEPIKHYPRPSLRVAYAPPESQTEQTIAQIWRELLGVGKIGVHDNFLELGGDSLLAVRLISRLRDAFQQDIPIRLIFEASTVAELAKAIERMGADDPDSELEELMNLIEQFSEEEAELELLKRRQYAEQAE